MKKLLVALALLTVSTLSFADDDEVKVVPVVSPTGLDEGGIFIVDGKKVYRCNYQKCFLVSGDYTKVSLRIIKINGKDVK
mgnify:CR=1 FL=1